MHRRVLLSVIAYRKYAGLHSFQKAAMRTIGHQMCASRSWRYQFGEWALVFFDVNLDLCGHNMLHCGLIVAMRMCTV